MNTVAGITHFPQLLLLLLVSVVSSQSYPRFELGENNILNNSILFHGSIGEGQDDSLRCVTDNSECCSNGQGNWFDERGDEVHQGSVGNSDQYVTRGQRVVYLNRRGGRSVGLWRCGLLVAVPLTLPRDLLSLTLMTTPPPIMSSLNSRRASFVFITQ